MDIKDNKIEEVTAYRKRKVHQAQARLTDMGTHARIVQNHKLADIEEQLIYKVLQLCDRMNDEEAQEAKIENKGRWVSTDNYN